MAHVDSSPSSSSNEPRKKRTRPVSACESCHSKKIKCILNPGEPACQRCSSSGKECLFRIDDLSPALRMERFADYGPISIASSSKDEQRTKARRSHSGSSSRASAVTKAGSNNSKTSVETQANGKSKAIFRSFANVEKLAPPSRTGLPIAPTEMLDTSKTYPTTSQAPMLQSQRPPKERKRSYGVMAASEHPLREINRPNAPGKKIALPFFRWFGATANTPGIRKIKVGVYHEEDVDVVEGGQRTRAEMVGKQLAAQQEIPRGAARRDEETIAGSSPRRACHCLTDPSFATSSSHLFESERPRYPRRDLLIHMSRLMLQYFKALFFPWLDEAELMAGAESGELPAILANSICSVSARISGHADLQRDPSKHAGEAFADMAKVLLVPMLSWPSIDVIEALVMISYAEFAAGADSGLWMYLGMALRMAMDLGLQHEAKIQSITNKKQQDRARLLFWAIICLDRTTSFGTGRSLSVREDLIDSQLPALEEDPSSNGFVFGHIVRTLLKRGRIGELLNQGTDDLSREERGRKLQMIWHDLAQYYQTLPPTLQFGVTTFRKLANANQGAAFVYLHVLLQSTMSLLNRPSLFRRFDKNFSLSVPSELASISSHASGTIVSILRFAEDASLDLNESQKIKDERSELNPYIDCNPYLDQFILPAGRAFLAEREGVRDALRRLGYATQSRPPSPGALKGSLESSTDINEDPTKNNGEAKLAALASLAADGPFNGLVAKRQYAQMNLYTCQKVLDRLALWWSGAEWPARALRQESSGATGDDVDPDSDDEDAQPAPIRDVEMVLKWAKARVNGSQKHNSTTPMAMRRKTTEPNPLHHETGDVDMSRELSSLLSGQYVSGESTSSEDSPLGLGFSGSFGTTTEIDLQAFINAWTNEDALFDSSQHNRQSATSSRPRFWDPVRSSYLSEFSSPFPSSSSTVEHTIAAPQHHHQPTAFSAANGLLGDATNYAPPNGMFDVDLSTMQLEEFFKDTTPNNRPDRSQDLTAQGFLSSAGVNGWDELPSALINAFTSHYSAPSHDYNGSYIRRAPP